MQNKKETAWKKNRKFSDIHGGRERLRLEDNIFKRAHTLKPPGINDEIPIFIVDNPSRDFYHPLSIDEIKNVLSKFSKEDTNSITHIWLRKVKKKEYDRYKCIHASFICGSGVRLIELYPWPINLKMALGKTKPSKSTIKHYSRWDTILENDCNEWILKWEKDKVKSYYSDFLLLHEIGHHIDWYRRKWSKANINKCEEFADQFAFEWSQLESFNVSSTINRSKNERVKLHC